MTNLARILVLSGLALVAAGLVVALAAKLGLRFPPLGRLPGDIQVQKPGFQFYFPLTTSILISVILSLALYLYRYFSK